MSNDLESSHNMRIAAGDLVTSCVRNRGTGGTVKGLGKKVFKPAVQSRDCGTYGGLTVFD